MEQQTTTLIQEMDVLDIDQALNDKDDHPGVISTQPQPSYKHLCSFCYISLEKTLRCGKCKKHPYCCRSCQKSDWKQHKIWCENVAELNIDFEVKDSDGKGMGIFAKRSFEKGEKILVERPVIRVDHTGNLKAMNRQFDAQLPSVQSAIENLHCTDRRSALEKDLHRILGKGVHACKKNIIGLGENGSGLFIIASRLNHNCLPNCTR
jgi:hypothetical protein